MPVVVSPECQIAGALGAALIGWEIMFKGIKKNVKNIKL